MATSQKISKLPNIRFLSSIYARKIEFSLIDPKITTEFDQNFHYPHLKPSEIENHYLKLRFSVVYVLEILLLLLFLFDIIIYLNRYLKCITCLFNYNFFSNYYSFFLLFVPPNNLIFGTPMLIQLTP